MTNNMFVLLISYEGLFNALHCFYNISTVHSVQYDTYSGKVILSFKKFTPRGCCHTASTAYTSYQHATTVIDMKIAIHCMVSGVSINVTAQEIDVPKHSCTLGWKVVINSSLDRLVVHTKREKKKITLPLTRGCSYNSIGYRLSSYSVFLHS